MTLVSLQPCYIKMFKLETEHHQLIAEIISWFDVIAVQEVKDDLSGLRAIQAFLPGYRTVFTDKGGNDERMAYLYDSAKITTLDKFGELAICFLPGIKNKLTGSNGVFDYDGAIFPAIFNNHTPGEFREYLRYYISDYRPLWLELDVT